jgi:very-short-patch-repair endonuclease
MLAHALRRNRTLSEKRVWQHLKNRQVLGFKFRQQAPIAQWIADFYCPAAGLVVELDGSFHEKRAAADKLRDKAMADMGLHVLRIRSSLVFTDLDCVIGQIDWALRCSGADPVTGSDAVRLQMADTHWEFSTQSDMEDFVKGRLRGLHFDLSKVGFADGARASEA